MQVRKSIPPMCHGSIGFYSLFVYVCLSGGLAFVLAYTLRFVFEIPSAYVEQCLSFLPTVALAKAGLFYLLGGNREFRRQALSRELVFALTFCGICSTLLLLQRLPSSSFDIPKGVIALDFLVTLCFLGVLHVSGRMWKGLVGSVGADSEQVESTVSEFLARDDDDRGGLSDVKTPLSPIQVASPTLPDLRDVVNEIRESYSSGMVTSGTLVGLLEEEVKSLCNVEHAIVLSSGTSGLMLAIAAMHLDDGAEVIVPSFTFSATVQALLWNNLTPVYVDCLLGTLTVDPGQVEKAISSKTAAILPVNIFGVPPDLDELEAISMKHGIPLIYDSAQGLGSTFMGRPSGGFGVAEVFSLSPSKVVTAVEGGIVTTNDRQLAEEIMGMRNYGKDLRGDQMISKGLSSRMIEFNAAVGLLNMRKAASSIASRLKLVSNYRTRFGNLRGCRMQEIPENRTTNGGSFCLLISKETGMDRDRVSEILAAKEIQTRKYFFPPAHAHDVFRRNPHRIVGELANTWAVSSSILILPLYSHMTPLEQDRVCTEVESCLANVGA